MKLGQGCTSIKFMSSEYNICLWEEQFFLPINFPVFKRQDPKKHRKANHCSLMAVITLHSRHCAQKKKQSYNISVQYNDLCLTSLIVLPFSHTNTRTKTRTHTHTHWHTWSGGVADVGTFVLWDKSCFIGTDYRFILPLQTPANITLHTNGLHQPERDKGKEGNKGEGI